MKKYTADFETSTLEWYKKDKKARVWAYAICEIGNYNNLIIGNSIDDFLKWCSRKNENPILYFHNLKYDSEYISYRLLELGFTYYSDKKDRKDKSFTMLISGMGQFYSMEIIFEIGNKKVNKVTIYDSLKLLNFSVEKIAKDFDLPIRKLDLDYDKYRPVGHLLTPHEIEYIKNDVEIMSRALEQLFSYGFTKMTIGSSALHVYKTMISNFSNYYPVLDYNIDHFIRESYKGGFTYLNSLYKDVIVGKGIVIDCNSMHPSQMRYEYLPFGEPLYFSGEYKYDKYYPLYIISFSCSFKIKENMIPTVQLKNNPSFMPTDYIETTDDKIVTLTLTSVDYDLFREHYDIDENTLSFHGGYKFKSIKGLFNKYIDYFVSKKIEADKTGNKVLRTICKLALNSLYGKYGTNPNVISKKVILEDERIKYPSMEKEIRDSVYCPVASFITAYSRKNIITNSQKIRDYSLRKYGKDYYYYSDTDSIHCNYIDPQELSKIIPLDDYKLGYYKIESYFKRAKFIRQKCYIEEYEENDELKLNVTIAGMPKKLGKYINFDNFKEGFSILKDDSRYEEKKFTYFHVKGGVLLAPTDFTIKKG